MKPELYQHIAYRPAQSAMKEFVAFIVGVVIAGLGLATNCLVQTTPKSVDRLLSIYSKRSPLNNLRR